MVYLSDAASHGNLDTAGFGLFYYTPTDVGAPQSGVGTNGYGVVRSLGVSHDDINWKWQIAFSAGGTTNLLIRRNINDTGWTGWTIIA